MKKVNGQRWINCRRWLAKDRRLNRKARHLLKTAKKSGLTLDRHLQIHRLLLSKFDVVVGMLERLKRSSTHGADSTER